MIVWQILQCISSECKSPFGLSIHYPSSLHSSHIAKRHWLRSYIVGNVEDLPHRRFRITVFWFLTGFSNKTQFPPQLESLFFRLKKIQCVPRPTTFNHSRLAYTDTFDFKKLRKHLGIKRCWSSWPIWIDLNHKERISFITYQYNSFAILYLYVHQPLG